MTLTLNMINQTSENTRGAIKGLSNSKKRFFSSTTRFFYRYLKLHIYFNKCDTKYPIDLEDPVLKDILSMYKTCESNKGTIFRMYKGFLTKKTQNMWSTDSIKNKWEKERD